MFSKYEESLRHALEENINFQFYNWENQMKLCFQCTEDEHTSEQREVITHVTLQKDLSSINIEVTIYHTYGIEEDEPNYAGTSSVPLNEEAYFQMSTVQEPLFTYEFYKYLISEFKKLRINS